MEENFIRSNYLNLTKLLIEKNISISTMESATSGQIASLITDTPGASAIFKGAYISYSNEEKIRLGVPSKTIETFSVYSEETACEMANICRKDFIVDIGIGITGTMGNIDPKNSEASIPGKVFFAISTPSSTYSFSCQLESKNSRLEYKLAVAQIIYEKLISIVENWSN